MEGSAQWSVCTSLDAGAFLTIDRTAGQGCWAYSKRTYNTVGPRSDSGTIRPVLKITAASLQENGRKAAELTNLGSQNKE